MLACPALQDERVALLSISLEDLRGRGTDIAARLRKQAGAMLMPTQGSPGMDCHSLAVQPTWYYLHNLGPRGAGRDLTLQRSIGKQSLQTWGGCCCAGVCTC